jgi:hypothetical protein
MKKQLQLLMGGMMWNGKQKPGSRVSPSGMISIPNTVDFRLSDINGTEGQSDKQKRRIIQKTNEKDEGKYQLKL